jgi:hypothetical protein
MRQSVSPHQKMEPPSQVGNGENYPSFDSPDRGVASLILGVGKEAVQGGSNVRFDPLAPHIDFLFDRGLIGFEDDGRALFSSLLTDADAQKLGLHQVERPPRRPFRRESNSYFQHHRANVFIN